MADEARSCQLHFKDKTGKYPIYPITTVGNVVGIDKAYDFFYDGSIPLNKIDGVEADIYEIEAVKASANIIDPAALNVGIAMTNGTISTSTAGRYTGFIDVAPGDIVRIVNWCDLDTSSTPRAYPIIEYDVAEAQVGYVNREQEMTAEAVTVDGEEVTAYAYTIPEGVSKIRVNIVTGYVDVAMVTINHAIPDSYEPYREAVEGSKEYSNFDLSEKLRVRRSVHNPFNGFLHICYSQFGAFAPINTVSMYETAGFLDFDAIKGDVRLSADDVLIMCHDAGLTLDDSGQITTYNASNSTPIREMQSADILALEHAAYGMGEHPCTIDDYLQVCAKWGKIPFVTVRDEYMDTIAPLLIAALKRWNLLNCAIVNSFTVESLETVRKQDRYVWLNQVMNRTLVSADIKTAENLYPCALSPYTATSGIGAAELQELYDSMEPLVEECRSKGIPVLTANCFTREQYNFYLTHYSGAQMHQIMNAAPRRRFFVHMSRTDGAWAFTRYSYAFEHTGTITEEGGAVQVQCNEILSSWVRYMVPAVTAKCTSDNAVSVTVATHGTGLYFKLTPSTIEDGMSLLLTVEF